MDLTSEEFKEFYRKAFGVLDIDSDSFGFNTSHVSVKVRA